MKISMILPIYNESSTIDGMMDQLRALPGDWEILFADGGSRDGTVQRIGTEFPVLKSPKGRAAQMNDYNGPFMGCNTFFSNRRARRGIAFGDQGIWIRRELFLSLGGFPELPIMEDYEFSLRMKERGIPIRLLPGRIITSGRRYRKGFPLFTMWNMYRLRQMYRAGVDISEIAERYRDIR